MRFRRLAIAALAVALTTPAAHAEEDDKTVFGVNLGLAGTILKYTPFFPPVRSTPGYFLGGECSFAGVLTPANTLIVQYAGTATAKGPAMRTTPLLTAIECEINNFSSGGSNSQSRDISLNGSAAAVADSTVLATSGPKEWPVQDVTICIEVFAIWGPTPVQIVTVPRTCAVP